MTLSRRNFLYAAAGAFRLSGMPGMAWAQDYPTRPVHFIVPFAAGGNADLYARLIGHWLSDRFGQAIVVENRGGANTRIGTEAVVHSSPDGYTILLVALSAAANSAVYGDLSYSFSQDIAPVAGLIHQYPLMLVNPSLPVKTVAEFITFAKANPEAINFASQGQGSPAHLFGELFKAMTGLRMVHVPYRGGGPALKDLIAGQVQVMFISAGASIQYVKAGKLRALAVCSPTRLKQIPDLPTASETVPGFAASSWFGVGAPRNTPIAIIERINREINAGLADPTIASRIAATDAIPFAASPQEFGEFVADETKKWSKVIIEANIKPSKQQ